MLLKRKLPFLMLVAGFLTGIAIFYIFIYINWPFAYFPGWKRERWNNFFKNEKHMTTFFSDNREKFKSLELYFEEDREWSFGFYQYNSSFAGVSTYRYRTTEQSESYPRYGVGDIASPSYNVIASREISMLSAALKEFLDFTVGKNEVNNVILHGDHDIFDPHRKMKRYLEVRCSEGEDLISYIYAPDQIEKDEWDTLIDLNDGWYFGICKYTPIHLRDSG